MVRSRGCGRQRHCHRPWMASPPQRATGGHCSQRHRLSWCSIAHGSDPPDGPHRRGAVWGNDGRGRPCSQCPLSTTGCLMASGGVTPLRRTVLAVLLDSGRPCGARSAAPLPPLRHASRAAVLLEYTQRRRSTFNRSFPLTLHHRVAGMSKPAQSPVPCPPSAHPSECCPNHLSSPVSFGTPSSHGVVLRTRLAPTPCNSKPCT